MKRHVFGFLFLAAGCASEPAADTTKSTNTTDTGCESSADSDNDGLDDCTEVEMGTDPSLADTDGDGLTDNEEVLCVSNPNDPAEVCYACGWPHGDDGTLAASGAEEGDVVANLQFADPCEETVSLWDFQGQPIVMFLTAAWCPNCKAEAANLENDVTVLASEYSVDIQPMIVLFESRTAGPPAAADAIAYAAEIDAGPVPVFADTAQEALQRLPYDGHTLPGVCLLDAEMRIVTCRSGQDQVLALTDVLPTAIP